MKKIVSIIGRPNVGKSTLFNRIIGKRKAIVHETSGVTRDRNYQEVEWCGKHFFIVDTGGFIPYSNQFFDKQIYEQINFAIDESDKIIFLVDGNTGIHPVDEELSKLLRKYTSEKEIILVVNKIDNTKRELNVSEFYSLGFSKLFSISGLSGKNVADLLDFITRDFSVSKSKIDKRLKIAIIGKPNVGKSSIVNAILNSKRNIVSEVPGTTRDSVDSIIKYYGEEIVLIDTAGINKKNKFRSSVSLDFYSAVRTYNSIKTCDVAVLIVDSQIFLESIKKSSDINSAIIKLDKNDIKIINEVITNKKGLLLLINKWDIIPKGTNTAKIIESKIKDHLKTFSYIKIIFVSAINKIRIHKIIPEAISVFKEKNKKIKTSLLNKIILDVIKNKPHPSVLGKEVKINYVTQLNASHPIFSFFSNYPDLVNNNYKRFLEKKIREYFSFSGVPIEIIFNKKN